MPNDEESGIIYMLRGLFCGHARVGDDYRGADGKAHGPGAIAGRGGKGTRFGRGGDGGDATVIGKGRAVGGDGGDCV